MKDVGTLKELGVNPGDVVQQNGQIFDIVDTSVDNSHPRARLCYGEIAALSRDKLDHQPVYTSFDPSWHIISRASDTPKLWRDMTPEEKGALLLAHHDGKKIEGRHKTWAGGAWIKVDYPAWSDDSAYRVRPEPKVETIAINDWEVVQDGLKGHRITFNTIDGKPDCNSIKMEPVK